jgi:hypothetical protein
VPRRESPPAGLWKVLGWLVCASIVYGFAKSSIIACVLVGVGIALAGIAAVRAIGSPEMRNTLRVLGFITSAAAVGWGIGLKQLASVHELAALPSTASTGELLRLCNEVRDDMPQEKKEPCANAFADQSVIDSRGRRIESAETLLKRASELAPNSPSVVRAQSVARAATLVAEARNLEAEAKKKGSRRDFASALDRLKGAQSRVEQAQVLDPQIDDLPGFLKALETQSRALKRDQKQARLSRAAEQTQGSSDGTQQYPRPVLSEGMLVAVLELQHAKAIASSKARFLTNVVRDVVLKAKPPVRVMTSENLITLIGNGVDLAACEGECEVETGRRIGADAVITGDLVQFGSQYKASLRLHETRSGRLLSSAFATASSTAELDGALREATLDLLVEQTH